MTQPLEFLTGGGDVGALMRTHDWSTSPLGRPESWPQSLRAVVSLLLQSRFPMFVAWGKDLGFLYNDPYAEILGAKHPRSLGRRFYDIWSEIWVDISPLIDAAMAGQATYHEDLPLLMNRKGYDEQTWFTFSYSPVRDESGRVSGMFCACTETTQKVLALRGLRELNDTLERRVNDAVAEQIAQQEKLRKAEAALRQTQKMESLGQLTGGVAHDFNNLLAVFASGLQLLERSAAAGGSSRTRVFEAMRRAIARGTGLTRHLLAFSRRRPVNPESIDIVSHLQGMRAMLDGSLGGNIDVQMKFGVNVWPVEVDTGEMELAILNLCLNARDAMTDGGVISIGVDNINLAEEGAGDFVQITVADTGHGMPPEVKARVFEPFFTTKDISKGSGLGLPQVYGFTQQSGGQVSIDSDVGLGTVVTLRLPRSLRDPVGRPETASDIPHKVDGERRGHVLLVEDDREVAALTRELLGALGFAVTHVSGAEAALGALANSRHIDTVLSDIMMPGGISGLQLAREIRQRYPTLPIILTTGYIEAAADMADGEFMLLPKPFTLEALSDALGVPVEQDTR